MRFQSKPSVTVLWHGTLEDSLVHSSMSEARTSSQILLHSMQAPHRNRQRQTEIHQTSHLLPWASNGQHTPAMFHQCFMACLWHIWHEIAVARCYTLLPFLSLLSYPSLALSSVARTNSTNDQSAQSVELACSSLPKPSDLPGVPRSLDSLATNYREHDIMIEHVKKL